MNGAAATSPHHPLARGAGWGLSLAILLLAGGCGTVPKTDGPVARGPESAAPPAARAPAQRGGGYYLDDGPGDNPPANLDAIPDAQPRRDPLRAAANRPYEVFGQRYVPSTQLVPYRAKGIASWYGRRYHGQKTSSGEVYDMYAMTAAHTTLPIPSYARVTNVKNGKSAVVRINDRGPFRSDRLIDLSYTAAYKLGVLGGGSAWVEVESLIPGFPSEPAVLTAAAQQPAPPPRPPEAALLASAEAGGVFLQLGAFGAKGNAENFLEKLRAQLSGFAEGLRIHSRDGLYRVQAGPYPTPDAARGAAQGIADAMGIRGVVAIY